MNYCDPDSFIGNFAPATSGSGTIDTKNVDCVSLESNTVTCSHLTIDGQDIIPNLTQAVNATRYQTTASVPISTQFAGNVYVNESLYTPNCLVGNIASYTANTDITIGSSVFIGEVTFESNVYIRTVGTTSTAASLMVLQPNALTNTSQSIQIGRSVTTNNYGSLKFNYLAANSTTNYAELSVGTNSGLQVYSTYINLPSTMDMRLNGYTIWPKRNVFATNASSITSSATTNLSFSTAYTHTTVNCARHVVFSFVDVEITDAVKTPCLRLCYNADSDYSASAANFNGVTGGTNGTTNSLLWGTNASNYSGTGIPLWQRNWPGAGYKLSGKIDMVLMSMSASGTTITGQVWSITGTVNAIKSDKTIIYTDTLAGSMNMNDSTRPCFRYLSVQWQTIPTSGTVNLMHS